MSNRRKNLKSLKPPEPFSEEWVILKIMEQWTIEDVDRAIANDVSLVQPIVNLLENNGVLSTIARSVLKKYWNKRSLLTAENVLYWLENRRLDLYRAITGSSKGEEWLRKNVDGLRTAVEEKLNSLKNAF